MKILARYINFEHILMFTNINRLNILTYWEEMYFSVKVDYQSTDYFQGTWSKGQQYMLHNAKEYLLEAYERTKEEGTITSEWVDSNWREILAVVHWDCWNSNPCINNPKAITKME